MCPLIRLLIALVVTLPLAGADRAPGLVGEYFEGIADYPSKYPADARPFFVRVDDQVDFTSVDAKFYGTKLADNFAVRWRGVLRVPVAGTWTLATDSDDGSRLVLDGAQVIDNSGRHPMQ
ncbi:MAG: hypothetical protein H0X45_13585, partial [Planctomycetes bacterium]|nr:hypothetical protein [Planctomycetota bacterium]